MRVVFRGNFQFDLPEHLNHGVPWSTEHYVAQAWEERGHEVVRVQENAVDWPETVDACEGADLFLWTCTWGYAHQWDQAGAHAAVERLNGMLPTAFWHLDKWWDLPRVDQVAGPDPEPWTKLAHVFTADGGNQDRWESIGVNHHWLAPGVAASECVEGSYRPEMASDVAFVGNWRGGYHPEWGHRAVLVRWLRHRYGHRAKLWPAHEQVRGRNLADLYASAKVVVGDSCLVGGRGRYCSDRIPETLGRHGFLLHPHVEGVTDGDLWTAGVDLECWDVDDFGRLGALIEQYVDDADGRDRIRHHGAETTRQRHTFANRVDEVVAAVFGYATGGIIPAGYVPGIGEAGPEMVVTPR